VARIGFKGGGGRVEAAVRCLEGNVLMRFSEGAVGCKSVGNVSICNEIYFSTLEAETLTKLLFRNYKQLLNDLEPGRQGDVLST
jgi:hypothetical protein